MNALEKEEGKRPNFKKALKYIARNHINKAY